MNVSKKTRISTCIKKFIYAKNAEQEEDGNIIRRVRKGKKQQHGDVSLSANWHQPHLKR